MERKLIDAPTITVTETGEIEGYASTFANFDRVGERVVKGAFAESLAGFLKDGFIAVGHKWGDLPIGVPLDAREDDHGLYVRAKFHSTPHAQDARTTIRERLEAGKSVKLSIGYDVVEDERVPEGRLLKKLRLYEWSFVTVPANSLADVTGVKGWGEQPKGFNQHSEAVEQAVQGFVRRAKSRYEARLEQKAGRTFSAANESRMRELLNTLQGACSGLEELLAMLEPAPMEEAAKMADPAITADLYIEYLRRQAEQRGVFVNA